VCLADVKVEPVEFLWRPRIPNGKLTILEGDPGAGKSFLTCALAAAISAGASLPGAEPSEPRSVLMFTGEDGLADTLAPRLDWLGADRKRIFAGPSFIDLSESRGVACISELVDEHRPALTVLDPITAYLGARTDTHRANKVRAVLAPLGEIASRFSSAFLIVRHLSKSDSSRALYRGLGSIDFTAAARSVLLAGTMPSDPEVRALVHIKSNLGPLAPTLGYRIDHDGQETRLLWTGECDITAGDLLADNRGEGRIDRARRFLRDLLSEGPMPASEIYERAEEEGIAKRTLQAAKSKEKIQANKLSFEGGWKWTYPSEDE